MKKLIIIILALNTIICKAQIASYNQFPAMQPQHILDENLDNISFALGMRILVSDYNGPLIRLRRASDNAEMDFYCGENDIVNNEAINIWRGSAKVYVVRWYDQSGLELHAQQNINSSQPEFVPNATQPYFTGDGTNDYLLVPENLQNLTESGKNGTVLGVFYATDRSDIAFGTVSGANRWMAHINWNNERCYFDPGYCCNNPRSFINNLPTNTSNPGSLGIWDQYSFLRRDDPLNATTDKVILRLAGIEKVNGGFPNSQSCSLTFNFGIGAAVMNSIGNATGYSTTRFAEMIMYKTGKEDSFLQLIEENQIKFWNL